MESNNKIDKKKLNESLNTLLNIFDESTIMFEGNVLPEKPFIAHEYDVENLTDKIINGNISKYDSNVNKKDDVLLSESYNEDAMEGLSLSQRLKAKLKASKAAKVQSEKIEKNTRISNPSKPSTIDISSNQNSQIVNPQHTYKELHDLVINCTHCPECCHRNNVLFGEGSLQSRLMVIGEGPGRNEDETGRLFVGPSGSFLDKWLKGINLDMHNDVYLSNIVKCFSGSNPTPQRADYCKQFLEKQIEFVKPEVILILGKVAANSLLNNTLPLNQMREKSLFYKNIPVVVTYHPAAVLRNLQWKRPVWNDLKNVANLLNMNLARR